MKSNSSKKVTFLNGIKAGSIYTLTWEDYEEETNTINGHEYVDLGLPSGLLWATCNVGANSPEEFGDYYAWGMTETKSDYSISNCPTYGLSYSKLQSQGYIDGNGNLTPRYDAATANWGGTWRMPTYDELDELCKNCTWTWTAGNGVYGYKVKGPNGNIIFLPAAGACEGSSLYDVWDYGHYWSSTPVENYPSYAFKLQFNDGGNHYMDNYMCNYRYCGQSVRPVSGGNVEEPEEPETPSYEYVDLGLSVKWATCNVGANSPEEYGDYFAWGETITKSTYDESNCSTYGLTISQLKSQGYIDDNYNLTAQHDAAATNWGGDWRIPTRAEQEELLNNCKWTWTTQNGVNGYRVQGPNGNSIFLPAAGYLYESSLKNAGSIGNYWNTMPDFTYSDSAWLLFIRSDNYRVGSITREEGRSVRPVLE